MMIMAPTTLQICIFFIFQFDFSSQRTPDHPCGKEITPIPGPVCFLYFDCSSSDEKNLNLCPAFQVFNENRKLCEQNTINFMRCASQYSDGLLDMKILTKYMNPSVYKKFENLAKFILDLVLYNMERHPCKEDKRLDCPEKYDKLICISPFDNCTGYYNCSMPLPTVPCASDEKFDDFSKMCVKKQYSSCGLGSSYPADKGNVDDKDSNLRLCSQNELDICLRKPSTKVKCISVSDCNSYYNCSLDSDSKLVSCRTNDSLRNEFCDVLMQDDCGSSVQRPSATAVNISSDSFIYKEGETAEFLCNANVPLIDGYVWYLNSKPIAQSARIRTNFRNNSSTLIYNPILESDSGILTCAVTYANSFSNNNSQIVIAYAIPVVRITPASFTSIGQPNNQYNFSCNANISNNEYSNVPLETAWYINGEKTKSDAFKQKVSQTFILNQTSIVQCGVNMSQIGLTLSNECRVTIIAKNELTCKDEDYEVLLWKMTKAGENCSQPCPNLPSGNVIRICLINGTWGEINFDECLSVQLNLLSHRLHQMSSSALTSSTLTSLTNDIPENISKTKNSSIVQRMSDVLYSIASLRNVTVGGSLEGASLETENILRSLTDVMQSSVWMFSNSTMTKSAVSLLQTLNVYSSHSWPDRDFKYFYNSSNNDMVFERSIIGSQDQLITFPRGHKSGNKIILSSKLLLSALDFLFQYSEKTASIPIGVSLTKRLGKYLINTKNVSVINSQIASLDVMTPLLNTATFKEVLIEFTLEHLENLNSFTPSCVYYQFNESLNGYWSRDGCVLKDSNNTHTTCQCYHLTNFAILFSPSAANEKDNAILSKITLIGCIISIVSLILTIVLYAAKWRVFKSKRAVLIICLCISLIFANVIFLAGVNRTSNPGICTAVAAWLHYFFLASFFMMLALAVHLFVSVFFVFYHFTKKTITAIIIVAWFAPMLIVAISLGATKLQGYGSELNCWLSLERGVLWAFVAPALVIICINLAIAISVLVRICRMKMTPVNTTKNSKWLSAAQNLLVLNPILGLTWIFGVLSVNQELVVFQYIFAITNSLQGFFIFLLHGICLKKNLSSKTKDQKQLPEKIPPSFRPRIDLAKQSQCQEYSMDTSESEMRTEEYFILDNGIASEAFYQPSR